MQRSLWLRFWWPGRDPESAFDPCLAFSGLKPREWEVMDNGKYRAPKQGATWVDVLNYIEKRDLAVTAVLCTSSRNVRFWEGRFEIQLEEVT